MIFIESVHLKGFQKHENLLVSFTKDINVLTGETGSGKSCIRRALEWVLRCENISNVQKLGFKKTSVIVNFTDGSSLERIKTSSINRYILRDNDEELVWDKFGRDLPDEIKDRYNLHLLEVDGTKIDLNIAKQIDSLFLIGKEYTGSFKLKLFNNLTGTNKIDTGIKNINKKLKDLKSEDKYTQNNIEENKLLIENKKLEYSEKSKKHTQLNSKYLLLNELQEKNIKISSIIQMVEGLQKEVKRLENVPFFDVSIDIKEVKDKIDLLTTLQNVHNSIVRHENTKVDLCTELKKIVQPDLDVSKIEPKISLYNTLSDDIKTIEDLNNRLSLLNKQMVDINKDLDKKTLEKDEILKQIKVCSECGQIEGTGEIL